MCIFSSDGHILETFQVLPNDESPLRENLSVEKTIDENDGEIYLKGVELSVPSGALTEPVTITVTIINNNYTSPSLGRKEALLSPLVECLPNGLQFKKTVLLTLPHCAHNIKEDWAKVNVNIMNILSLGSSSLLKCLKNNLPSLPRFCSIKQISAASDINTLGNTFYREVWTGKLQKFNLNFCRF